MPGFDLVVPETADEAIAALRALGPGEAAVLAGGTDLLLDVEEGRLTPRRLVSLRRLPWRTIDWTDGGLRIGATLPLRTLEQDPRFRLQQPGLFEAVRALGSVALRHRATIGGNLARSAPASDLTPVLLSLDAEVDLVGPTGDRRLSVDAFLHSTRRTALLPGELVRSVRIPEARPSAYLWQRVRPANDISQVAVAVAFSRQQSAWKVAVGGVAPRPALLPEAAGLLGAGRPAAEAIGRAADSAAARSVFVTDRRASEAYRRHLVQTLLRRAVATVLRQPGAPA